GARLAGEGRRAHRAGPVTGVPPYGLLTPVLRRRRPPPSRSEQFITNGAGFTPSAPYPPGGAGEKMGACPAYGRRRGTYGRQNRCTPNTAGRRCRLAGMAPFPGTTLTLRCTAW